MRIVKQEGNGPIDSRAKVMISDKKCGPIYLKYPKKTKSLKSSFLKTSILQSGLFKL